MKNVFKIFLIVSSLIFSTAYASSSSEEENLVTVRFRVKPDLGKLVEVCSRPEVVGLDFSNVKVNDGDLEVLFNALVEREKVLKGQAHQAMSLIDLRFGDITERGVLSFLSNLQTGGDGRVKIYPDVRDTILRLGLGLTDDFIESMQKVAPSVFSGGIEIVQ